MYVSSPVLIAIAAAFLALLLLLALRRRGSSRDLMAPPRIGAGAPAPPYAPPPPAWPAGAAPIGDLPADVAAEVRELLQQDRKIEAIKIARAATGLSLADAKDLVERV